MPTHSTLSLNSVSICFDLDGTVVDTAPDLIRVLNEVTAPDDVPPLTSLDARHLVGHGSLALIEKAYAKAGVALSAEHAAKLRLLFLDLYVESITQLSRPFPAVRDVLAELKRGGAQLSICTNKPGDMARSLLEQLHLSPFFDKIVGSGDTPHCKPAAQHIFTAVGHRGSQPIIMVGDSAPDVYAARAAKVPVILMSYGYCPVSVHSFGADAVLRSFRELPSALKSILDIPKKT